MSCFMPRVHLFSNSSTAVSVASHSVIVADIESSQCLCRLIFLSKFGKIYLIRNHAGIFFQ